MGILHICLHLAAWLGSLAAGACSPAVAPPALHLTERCASATVPPASSVASPVAAPSAAAIDTLEIDEKFGARVTTAVPVRIVPTKAPAVGYLRRGTLVRLLQKEGSDWYQVSTGFPGGLRAGGGFPQLDATGLEFWIPSRSAPRAPPLIDDDTQISAPRFGLLRELSFDPGGPPFSFVRCGAVRELESDPSGRFVRVLAEFEAGELLGWIQRPTSARIDDGCAALALGGGSRRSALPDGYLPAAEHVDAFIDFVKRGGTVYWTDGARARPICQAWTFKPSGVTRGQLVLDRRDRRADVGQATLAYQLNVSPPYISLACPEAWRAFHGVEDCIWDYAVVDLDPRGFRLISWPAPWRLLEEPHGGIAGYLVDAGSIWYRSRVACEIGTSQFP